MIIVSRLGNNNCYDKIIPKAINKMLDIDYRGFVGLMYTLKVEGFINVTPVYNKMNWFGRLVGANIEDMSW